MRETDMLFIPEGDLCRLAANSSPFFYIATPHQIVQADVEVVRQGDEDGGRWFAFPIFVVLVLRDRNTRGSCTFPLRHTFLCSCTFQCFIQAHIITTK